MKKTQVGFTLLELLLVIAVIGVITITNISNFQSEFEESINNKLGVRIANIILGIQNRAQDSVNDLPLGGYDNYFEFKFDDCKANGKNGIPFDDGNPSTDIDGFGNIPRSDPYPRGESFVSCPTPINLNSGAIVLKGNSSELPSMTINYPSGNETKPKVPPSNAIENRGNEVQILFNIEGFISNDYGDSVRKLTDLIDGIERTLLLQGISTPDQVELFPYTISEIDSLLNSLGSRTPYLEIKVNTNKNKYLRADGSQNIKVDAPLCWELEDPLSHDIETACLNMNIDALGHVNLRLSNSHNRVLNVVNSSEGHFISLDVNRKSRSSAKIYSVNTGERVLKPVCPVDSMPQIAVSIAGFSTDSLLSVGSNNWGDSIESQPNYGDSSEVGSVGVGWRTDGNSWIIDSNVASAGSSNPQDTLSRFNVITWCGA